MASQRLSRLSQRIRGTCSTTERSSPCPAHSTRCRTMATEVPMPIESAAAPADHDGGNTLSFSNDATGPESSSNPFTPPALVTLYSFPSLTPITLLRYSNGSLMAPLRRDILHRAVIFEGDATRKGLASSKTRYEVHGTHAKKRPQKGTGRARMGSKQSPINVGGGKTFGPKPRDFATSLNRKIYDLAWRTALSYRYRRGELIVVEGLEPETLDIAPRLRFIDPLSGKNLLTSTPESPIHPDRVSASFRLPWYKAATTAIRKAPASSKLAYAASVVLAFLGRQAWGKVGGRTTFITRGKIAAMDRAFAANDGDLGREARYLVVDNLGDDEDGDVNRRGVDVKDLLQTGRLVIEKRALDRLLLKHGGGVGRPIKGVGMYAPDGEVNEGEGEEETGSSFESEEEVDARVEAELLGEASSANGVHRAATTTPSS